MGMGTATAQTQVTAERLGLPLERVSFAYGESSFPGVGLAGGSQQTASVGAAVIAAHRELAAELLKLAGDDSPLAGLSLDEIGTVDGGLASLSEPQRWESYTEILERAGRDEVSVEAAAGGDGELVDTLVRGAVLRGARQHGHRGDAGQPVPRLVRLRAHHQPQDRSQPVPRQHHHGAGNGAHGGDAVRRARTRSTTPPARASAISRSRWTNCCKGDPSSVRQSCPSQLVSSLLAVISGPWSVA
jgi:hypothetical protein